MTQRVPSTAPTVEPMPPMTTMATRASGAVDEEVRIGERHLLGDAAEQATTDAGDPAGEGERPQLRRRRSDRVAGGRDRVVAHGERHPPDAGPADATEQRDDEHQHGEDGVVVGAQRSQVEAEQLAPRERCARRVAAAEDVEVVDPRGRRDRERERRDRQQQAGHPQSAGAEHGGEQRGERGGDEERHDERDAVQLEVEQLDPGDGPVDRQASR